jgi:hypothetical protein
MNEQLHNKWNRYQIKRGDIIEIGDTLAIFDAYKLVELFFIDNDNVLIPQEFDSIREFNPGYWVDAHLRVALTLEIDLTPFIKEIYQNAKINKFIGKYSGKQIKVMWSTFTYRNAIIIIYTSNDSGLLRMPSLQYAIRVNMAKTNPLYSPGSAYDEISSYLEKYTGIYTDYHLYVNPFIFSL